MEIQLINQNNQWLVDSRIIASGFNLDHNHLCSRLRERISALDFLNSYSSTLQGGRPQRFCLLTKRQALLVPAICDVTDESFAFSEKIVDKFLEMEKKLSSPQMPTNMIEALELALNQAKQIEAQKIVIEQQSVGYSRLKTESQDAFDYRLLSETAEGDVCISDFWKELRNLYPKLKRDELFDYFKAQKWIMKPRNKIEGYICTALGERFFNMTERFFDNEGIEEKKGTKYHKRAYICLVKGNARAKLFDKIKNSGQEWTK